MEWVKVTDRLPSDDMDRHPYFVLFKDDFDRESVGVGVARWHAGQMTPDVRMAPRFLSIRPGKKIDGVSLVDPTQFLTVSAKHSMIKEGFNPRIIAYTPFLLGSLGIPGDIIKRPCTLQCECKH